MKKLVWALQLAAVSLCASCAAPPIVTTSTRPSARPAYCMSYPQPGTCSTGQCDIAFAQMCPLECTDGTDGAAGQPRSCAPSMSCELAKTAEYHNCLARCAAIPLECR